ncbi:hypothetical protein AMTRI_Chr06g191720 [Amborella trichopoda]
MDYLCILPLPQSFLSLFPPKQHFLAKTPQSKKLFFFGWKCPSRTNQNNSRVPSSVLPEHVFALLKCILTMPKRCGLDLHCRSVHLECQSACLYCRSAVLHCRSVRVFALPEQVLIMPECCGSDLYCRSEHSKCQSECLYCQSACENKRDNAV